MSVLFIVLPLAIVLAGLALLAFIIAAKQGQFDDLDSPQWRMLFADSERPAERPVGQTLDR